MSAANTGVLRTFSRAKNTRAHPDQPRLRKATHPGKLVRSVQTYTLNTGLRPRTGSAKSRKTMGKMLPSYGLSIILTAVRPSVPSLPASAWP